MGGFRSSRWNGWLPFWRYITATISHTSIAHAIPKVTRYLTNSTCKITHGFLELIIAHHLHHGVDGGNSPINRFLNTLCCCGCTCTQCDGCCITTLRCSNTCRTTACCHRYTCCCASCGHSITTHCSTHSHRLRSHYTALYAHGCTVGCAYDDLIHHSRNSIADQSNQAICNSVHEQAVCFSSANLHSFCSGGGLLNNFVEDTSKVIRCCLQHRTQAISHCLYWIDEQLID